LLQRPLPRSLTGDHAAKYQLQAFIQPSSRRAAKSQPCSRDLQTLP
jgi:hypothetical protein